VGEMRYAYKILEQTPEGKRPFGKPNHRWENDIKIDLQERA
jgi:hypothetical protein